VSEEIITHSSLVGKLLVRPKVDIPAYTDKSDTYVSDRKKIAGGLARSRSAAYRSVIMKRGLYKITDRAVRVRNSLRRSIPRPIMLTIAFIICIFAAIREFTEVKYRWLNRYLGAFRYAISRRIANYCAPRAAGMLFLAVSVFAVVSSSIVGVGLQVYIDGNPVGFVSKRSDFIEVVERVEDKVSQILGYPYTLNADVSYNIEMFNRKEILDLDTAERMLFSGISEIEQAYVVTVDGEVIGAHRDREAIDTILNSFLQSEMKAGEGETISKVEFVRDVDVKLQYTNVDNIKTLSDIDQALSSNVRDRESYTVQAGDVFETIAKNHGLSKQALIELNPDVDPDTIKEGQVLTVKEEIPLLSMRTIKTQVTEEEIPFETEHVDDKTLFVGVKKTKVKGQNGRKLVTTEIVSVDGEVESSTVLNEEIIEEPVTEVIRVGTKKRAPTGSYIVPYNGTISSRFGWRMFRGRYDYHTGIDFAGPKGSLVVASDGGTVTKAGWYGAYGYCVIINHGKGVQTLYGHNSKLLVKVGDKVAQGEAIARVGSTGRSTGPHVHFEIRINGKAVNPAKYLWK
jgi:murein DD-endopeptidase MepM/ murein hydrolase activator NlpD